MNYWKQDHSDRIPLVTSNERIDQENILEEILEEMMADIGHGDMEEMTRRYGEEEVARLMGEIVKNNEILIKMQKQLEKLLGEVEKKKWQEDREREQKEIDKWLKECRKRNEKEREENRRRMEKDRRYEKERGKES